MNEDRWSRRSAMMAMGIPVMLAQPVETGGGALSGGDADAADKPVLSVARMGAAGDGRTDDTRAFQRTVDQLAATGGGTMVLPAGVFRTGTVRFPYEPAVIAVVGAGTARSIWEMAAPDQPVIAIDPRQPPRRCTGARFQGFSVRAHPAGRVDNDGHVAIDCTGFSDVVFSDMRFLSNGKGSVGSWFQTSAHPHLSYHQRFSNLVCEKGVGPGRVLRTVNAGSVLNNTNVIAIDGFWVYANEGMAVAFDLLHTTTYSIRSGLIESSGQDAIRLGQVGVVESIWIEDMKGRPLWFDATADGTSSSNVVSNVYLSGFGGEIAIPRDCTNNVLTNVTGGNFRVVKADQLGGNVVVNTGGPRQPPRMSQFAGAAARLRDVQAYRASGLGERWNILCEVTPRKAGAIGLRVVPPAGSHVTSVHVSAIDPATGTPLDSAAAWPIGDMFVAAQEVRPISVVVQLTLE